MRNSSNGFSIVEVLAVTAIMGVVAVSMASLFSMLNQATNSVKFRTDADVLNEEIRAVLSSDVACTNTFGGQLADATTNYLPTVLKDGSVSPGVAAYTKDNVYGDNSVILQKLTLKDFVLGATANQGKLTLYNELASRKPVSGPSTVIRKIEISVERNGTNHISRCTVLARQSDGIWRKSPTNFDNIFFTGGNVGIGTGDPVAALDIAGGIRMGNDASVCDAAHPNTEGILRYNATSTPKQMEYCNGTTWGSTGSSGGNSKDATIGPDGFAAAGYLANLISVTCSGSGQPILLTFQTVANSGTFTGAFNATYQVYRNNVAIYSPPHLFHIWSGGVQTPHAFMYKDSAAVVGANVYRLSISTSPNINFETPQLKCESL